MKFSYNKKIDALYIRFNDKPIIESDQVSDSIIIDYDKNGRIIALEILDASKGEGVAVKKRLDIEKIAESNRAFSHFRW